jgi:hypothetical protein
MWRTAVCIMALAAGWIIGDWLHRMTLPEVTTRQVFKDGSVKYQYSRPWKSYTGADK